MTESARARARMRAAAVSGPSRAEIVEVDRPSPDGSEVLVKVAYAPLCTEFQAFAAGDPVVAPGHEAMGVVADPGASRVFSVGDRVVAMPLLGCGRCDLCRAGEYIYCEQVGNLDPSGPPRLGTMAEYLVKPDHLLIAVPDDIASRHAAMACCGLGASYGAFERNAVTAADTVLVTGLGPVGLGAVVNAGFRGARVIGVEANPYRAALALALGAEQVLHPSEASVALRELTGGRLADLAVECSGAVAAHRLAIEGVRRLGTVAFVGNSRAETPIVVSRDLLHRGVRLMGSWHYPLGSASRLMDQIRQVATKLDTLITHTFSLDQVEAAWNLQASGNCGKVLLEVDGDA